MSTKGLKYRFISTTHPPSSECAAPSEDEVLASIFDTLLSSQGSDAHRSVCTLVRLARGSWVKPYRIQSWAISVIFLVRKPVTRAWLSCGVFPTVPGLSDRLQLALSPSAVLRRRPSWWLISSRDRPTWCNPARAAAWCPFLPLGLTSRTVEHLRRRNQIGP